MLTHSYHRLFQSCSGVVAELRAELDRRTATQNALNAQHEAYAQKIVDALRLAEAERKADTDRLDEAIVQEVAARHVEDEKLREVIRANDVARRADTVAVQIEVRFWRS